MKKFNIISPLVFTLLLLFSAGSQCGYENVDISEEKKMIEVLYGVEIYSDSFEFQVLSNGCTHNHHFKLQANQLNDNQISVQLIRTKQDLCRALPWLINIKVAIPFSDILYPEFIFTNPFKNKHSLKNIYGN